MFCIIVKVQASWSVFIVGQMINFGLVPVPLRICFAMVLTFIFNIILALIDANAESAEGAREALMAQVNASAAAAIDTQG